MATVIEARREDDVEAALIQLDRDFATIYGPDMNAWSRGVRGELLEMQRARRTADMEAHPLHPRKSSAGRRRRHLKQLGWRVHAIAPDAVTVLLTPVWTDTHGPFERVFVVTARDASDTRLKLPRGGSRSLAALMQSAFPAANWDRPHTWHSENNTLATWRESMRRTA